MTSSRIYGSTAELWALPGGSRLWFRLVWAYSSPLLNQLNACKTCAGTWLVCEILVILSVRFGISIVCQDRLINRESYHHVSSAAMSVLQMLNISLMYVCKAFCFGFVLWHWCLSQFSKYLLAFSCVSVMAALLPLPRACAQRPSPDKWALLHSSPVHSNCCRSKMSATWKDQQATHNTLRSCAEPPTVDLQWALGCSLQCFPGNFSVPNSRGFSTRFPLAPCLLLVHLSFFWLWSSIPISFVPQNCIYAYTLICPPTWQLVPPCYLLMSAWEFFSPTLRDLPVSQDPLILAVCAFLPMRKKDGMLPHSSPLF